MWCMAPLARHMIQWGLGRNEVNTDSEFSLYGEKELATEQKM